MRLKEAAEYLGITEEELIRSRKRGLPPGSLGYIPPGEDRVWENLYFPPQDLIPPPAPGSIAADPEAAADRIQAIAASTASHVSADVAPRGPQEADGDQEADVSNVEADNPLYCWHCDREFSTAAGKASHDRATHA